MTGPADDLLLRVVGELLGARRCVRCGAQLSRARLELLESSPDAVGLRTTCACGETVELRAEPEADGGAAHVVR